MNKYSKGDKVRFKGDDVTYTVSYVNIDHLVDLNRVADRSPDITYVPTRLLEPAPRDLRVGDVYRGRRTGALYVIVLGEDGGLGATSDGHFSYYDMDQFHDTTYYELFHEGPKL